MYYVSKQISKEYSDGSYEDQTSEELQLIPRESLKLVSDYEKKLFEKCPYSVDCFKLVIYLFIIETFVKN